MKPNCNKLSIGEPGTKHIRWECAGAFIARNMQARIANTINLWTGKKSRRPQPNRASVTEAQPSVMRRLLPAVALVLLSVSLSHASLLTATVTNQLTGLPDTNVIRAIPLNDFTPVLADGTWVSKGTATRITPNTNGTFRFWSAPGFWAFTNVNGLNLTVGFYDTSSNATAYVISGGRNFYGPSTITVTNVGSTATAGLATNAVTATNAPDGNRIASLAQIASSNYLQSVAASNYLQSVAASNYVSQSALTSSNYVGTNAVNSLIAANGAVTNLPEVLVFSNKVVYANGQWYSYPSSTTAGIQEAKNLLLQATNYQTPGGGVIKLSPGIFYISRPIYLTNEYNATYTIQGAGKTATFIVQTNPCEAIYIERGTNLYSLPIQFYLRDFGLAITTNASTNIIYAAHFSTFDAANLWVGHWGSMTNNNYIGGTPNIGLTPSAYGTSLQSNQNLIAMYLDGGGADNIGTVRNCDFFSTLCGIYTLVDHLRAYDNMFLFCGLQTGTARSTNDLASTGAGICIANASYHLASFRNNHQYGGNAAYAIDGTGNIEIYGDSLENKTYRFLVTPRADVKVANIHGVSFSGDSLIGGGGYSVLGRIESGRIVEVKSEDPFTVSGSLSLSRGSILANYVLTNQIAASYNVYGGDPAAAIAGFYSRVGSGTFPVTYTNAGTGKIIYDDGSGTRLIKDFSGAATYYSFVNSKFYDYAIFAVSGEDYFDPLPVILANFNSVNGYYNFTAPAIYTTGTNLIAVAATGATNSTPNNYQISITAGSGMTMKDTNSTTIFTPVANGCYPFKPGWKLTGTGITGICIIQ